MKNFSANHTTKINEGEIFVTISKSSSTSNSYFAGYLRIRSRYGVFLFKPHENHFTIADYLKKDYSAVMNARILIKSMPNLFIIKKSKLYELKIVPRNFEFNLILGVDL